MRKILSPLLAVLLLGSAGRALRAEEDDDDPKARHAAPAARKPAPAVKAAEPVKPKTAAAEPVAPPVAKKTAPVAEPATAAKKTAPVAEPAPPAKKAVPAAAAAKPEEPAPRREPAPGPKKTALPPPPGEARTTALPPPPSTSGEGPATGARPVRVRLVDGSTVVGQVRAEQADSLVIDCALGQLAIPRGRISTIAYDSAAGIGSKRAPVQQLDDGDLPAPRRRPTAP